MRERRLGIPQPGGPLLATLGGVIMALGLALLPRPAYAAGGGKESGLSDIVFIVIFLGVAYALTRVVVNALKKRRIILSGVEYILLGLALKYTSVFSGMDILTPERLSKMSPVITLVIGVLGLVVGLQYNQHREPPIDRDAVRGAMAMGFIPALLTTGVFLLWYQYFGMDIDSGKTYRAVGAACAVLAITSVLSDSELTKNVIAHAHARKGRVSRFLYNSSWLSELMGIVLFGIMLCVLHEDRRVVEYGTTIVLNASDWILVNLILGALLGVIFALFLGREEDDDRLLLAGIGIIVFACGLAYYLHFSALFINFVIGFFLGRFTLGGRRLLVKLYPFVEPCYVVILLFAGLFFEVPPWQGWVLAFAYIITRFVGKLIGGRIFYRQTTNQQVFTSSISKGLLAPGAIAIAMVLKYEELFDSATNHPLVSTVLMSILLTFIIHQFLGPKLIRDVLVDAGELREGDEEELLSDLVFEADLVWSDDELDEELEPITTSGEGT